MLKPKTILAVATIAGLVGIGALAATGRLPLAKGSKPASSSDSGAKAPLPIAVTAARAHFADFVATVIVTGSLAPREEILVGPEVEGLRIVEVLADEGDMVKKGQVLARLVSDTLAAQLAQNDAAIARSNAAIAQATSTITAADARLTEARNNYNRGKPLAKSGYISESGMDQRESALKTAEASLATARDGLRLAEAEKAQLEAQRREISWRRERTDIVAPTDGLISRRVARVGGYAAGVADPIFRIVAKGEIELDAEVSEASLSQIKIGQSVEVFVAGTAPKNGQVRLVSPEVDKGTRLGRTRIFLGADPLLRVGSFARGTIVVARSRGIAVPASAILYGGDGPSVQVIANGIIKSRKVKLGLDQTRLVEVREGLAEGDVVVAKSGTFLRDGDAVRAIISSEAQHVGSAG